MYKASLQKHNLIFKEPGGTSRGVLTSKTSYYISLYNEKNPDIKGLGECSILPGLSPDERPELEEKLNYCCQNINDIIPDFHNKLIEWPAIRFAVEMALADLENGGKGLLFNSAFTQGKESIPINGLIWMGSAVEMHKRIEEKLAEGFKCLKLKIGALNIESELELIASIRKSFDQQTIELRVDANGAFSPKMAGKVLERLAKLGIHSIEQPIKARSWKDMAELCKNTVIPIALDEELIGLPKEAERREMLEAIRPQYIILKPSLVGGFKSSENWISLAESLGIGWWVTSALEANSGLNAIAQWTATLDNNIYHGLGTGQVFSNNIPGHLIVEKGRLKFSQGEQ